MENVTTRDSLVADAFEKGVHDALDAVSCALFGCSSQEDMLEFNDELGCIIDGMENGEISPEAAIKEIMDSITITIAKK